VGQHTRGGGQRFFGFDGPLRLAWPPPLAWPLPLPCLVVGDGDGEVPVAERVADVVVRVAFDVAVARGDGVVDPAVLPPDDAPGAGSTPVVMAGGATPVPAGWRACGLTRACEDVVARATGTTTRESVRRSAPAPPVTSP
jgi:hypothetical protein